MMEVVYVWPDGRQEVRYRRESGSKGANKLEAEVANLQDKAGRGGWECPYFCREAE